MLGQIDYDELVKAFRRFPGNYAAASRLSGVCVPTARKGWKIGWPERQQKPISKLLEEEAEEVRRRMEEMAERERKLQERERSLAPRRNAEQERNDAIKRREEWAKASGAARHNVQAMLVTIGQLLGVAYAKVGVVRDGLAKSDLPALQWLRIIKDLIQSGRMVHEAMHLTLQTEHLALGAPTAIIGVQHYGEVTLEDAERELAAANAAIERMRARRALPSAAEPLDAEFTEVGVEASTEAARAVEAPSSISKESAETNFPPTGGSAFTPPQEGLSATVDLPPVVGNDTLPPTPPAPTQRPWHPLDNFKGRNRNAACLAARKSATAVAPFPAETNFPPTGGSDAPQGKTPSKRTFRPEAAFPRQPPDAPLSPGQLDCLHPAAELRRRARAHATRAARLLDSTSLPRPTTPAPSPPAQASSLDDPLPLDPTGTHETR